MYFEPESLLTNPPGHLLHDEWTALSGLLSQNRFQEFATSLVGVCASGVPERRAAAVGVIFKVRPLPLTFLHLLHYSPPP